jgi:hypothetical protein
MFNTYISIQTCRLLTFIYSFIQLLLVVYREKALEVTGNQGVEPAMEW